MTTGRHKLRGFLRTAGALGLVLSALLPVGLTQTGCLAVTLYQPQKAIHRPVVVERAPETFKGLRVLVRCVSHKEHLPPGDASRLCSRLAEDLRRQGAETETIVPVGARFVDPQVFDGKRPDLTVEVSSQIEHEYGNTMTTIVACATWTIVPAVSEDTHSQRVVVYGKDRSVLTEEVFKERFVEYTGIGVWSLNWLLDWFVRDKANAISGDAGKKDFTEDFHGQIRQLVFNAKVRSEVLGLLPAPTRRPVVVPPASPSSTTPAESTTPAGAPSPEPPPEPTLAPDAEPDPPSDPSAVPFDPAED